MTGSDPKPAGVPGRRRLRRRGAACLALLLAGAAAAAGAPAPGGDRSASAASSPRRVLILSSFGSDFVLFKQIASELRTELARAAGAPLDVYEVPIDLARFATVESQSPFVDYLAALFANRTPALVVTLGGPAALFGQRFRARLFPGVPMLFAAVDSRFLEPRALTPLDATVAVDNDTPGVIETILGLLPDTEHVAVVLGDSPLERFWRDEIGQLFGRFEGRVHFIWLNGRSLEQILKSVATLPPRSTVFFVLLLVDGEGVPHSQERALAAVRAASTAPVFGVFDSQLGQGIVGGRLMPMSRVAKRAAEAAVRILDGEPPSAVRYPPMRPGEPLFDARELERWRIPASRLPPASEVRFRPRSAWDRFRWQIVAGAAVIALQFLLIAGLLLHRTRRHAAEGEVRQLHGRLLQAYEQERRRLARELHDDVTQRMARLAIDAAQAERLRTTEEGAATLRRMREELVRLGRDVHTLSRRLHPSILDDLGLAEAVRSEAERLGQATPLAVDVRVEEAPGRIPEATALCLFRVAQEALRNVALHASAGRVEVALAAARGGVELSVRDDGVGFEPDTARSAQGLGQVSMRERLALVGGRLSIESAPGRGTKVTAWAPLREEPG